MGVFGVHVADGGARPLRVAEFDRLFASALRGAERVGPTRLRLLLDAAAEAEARELTSRETSCCSFFTFTFTPAAEGEVVLEVGVPAAQVAVLDGLAALGGGVGPRR